MKCSHDNYESLHPYYYLKQVLLLLDPVRCTLLSGRTQAWASSGYGPVTSLPKPRLGIRTTLFFLLFASSSFFSLLLCPLRGRDNHLGLRGPSKVQIRQEWGRTYTVSYNGGAVTSDVISVVILFPSPTASTGLGTCRGAC